MTFHPTSKRFNSKNSVGKVMQKLAISATRHYRTALPEAGYSPMKSESNNRYLIYRTEKDKIWENEEG